MLLVPPDTNRISARLADRLWARLRHGRAGHAFRRQHALRHGVADFYCADAGLVVLIDGARAPACASDARADRFELDGFRLVRVSENELIDDVDAAARRIEEALRVAPLERVTSRPERAI